MSNQEILLGVNIDHCAMVRQARYKDFAEACGGIIEPDPVFFCPAMRTGRRRQYYRAFAGGPPAHPGQGCRTPARVFANTFEPGDGRNRYHA